MMYRLLATLACAAALGSAASPLVKLPVIKDAVRFAVLGDVGTGDEPQFEIAALAAKARAEFPFDFAVLLGDNLYGSEGPRDYERKFERPYKPLLDAGVKFYACLGNHDDPTQTSYKLYNMGGKRYYTFKPADGVRFFALDSNYMDKAQIEWVEKELAASKSEWKICFFHHPLYSSGDRHGPSSELRKTLEPAFIKYSVDLVLTGHEHFYERMKPQNGIYHFIAGSSAKLRKGDIRPSEITAKGYDQDRAFLLMQIAGDELYFQAIGRTGATLDSGKLPRLRKDK